MLASQRRFYDERAADYGFWRPDDLESRLGSIRWHVNIRRVGETFMYGAGQTFDS